MGASGWVRLGIRASRLLELDLELLELVFVAGDLLLEPLPLGDQLRPPGGVLLLARRTGRPRSGGGGPPRPPGAAPSARPSSSTNRSRSSRRSAGTLRLRQFCLTASTLARTYFEIEHEEPLMRCLMDAAGSRFAEDQLPDGKMPDAWIFRSPVTSGQARCRAVAAMIRSGMSGTRSRRDAAKGPGNILIQ